MSCRVTASRPNATSYVPSSDALSDYAFMQAEELGIKVYRPPTEMWGAYLTSDDEDSSDVRHVYRLVTYTPRGFVQTFNGSTFSTARKSLTLA